MNPLAVAILIVLVLLIARAASKKSDEDVPIPTRSCGCLGPCKCDKGNSTCQVRRPSTPGPCKINDELSVSSKKLAPNVFWENGEYPNAPAGFGLSSGEMKYQLPHPRDKLQDLIDNKDRLDIDMDRKTRLGYPVNPSCPCEPMAEQLQKASAWSSYVWQQPAPIMNYFKPPFPEDDMFSRDGMRLSLYGYSTPDTRDWMLDPHN
jgi:hypothetical protein